MNLLVTVEGGSLPRSSRTHPQNLAVRKAMSNAILVTIAFACDTISLCWFPSTFRLDLPVLLLEIQTHVLHTVANVCSPEQGLRRLAKVTAFSQPVLPMRSICTLSFLISNLEAGR